MEIIGANLSTNPDAIVVETQQNIQPSGSREVDHEIIDDTSHTPDHQVILESQLRRVFIYDNLPPVPLLKLWMISGGFSQSRDHLG
ncbi:hypothetical protein ACE6H2_026362 [Prunus campanulata]